MTCIVCYRKSQYFSIGECDHSVCFECSARMRVLLEVNECPICRASLGQVAFTTHPHSHFSTLRPLLPRFIFLPQWGIYIEDDVIKAALDKLLAHRCRRCGESFPEFDLLRVHVQRVHDLFTCDLCVANIKHFSSERKYYTRAELATHKRKGDRNDTSHRGHPLCRFCERRYFDSDELFKHLRKDHYFCHFCDADGLNHFYDTYNELRVHFRVEHFLCEEEHCKGEEFTNAFRTEIDLRAHLTTAHARLLGKHGTKEARKIDVEFSLPQRPRRPQQSRGAESPPEPAPTIPAAEPKLTTSDFPTLGGGASTPAAQSAPATTTKTIAQKLANTRIAQPWAVRVSGSGRRDEEFPALPGEQLVADRGSVAAPAQKKYSKTPAAAPLSVKKEEEFPSLSQVVVKGRSGGGSRVEPPPPSNFVLLKKREKNNNSTAKPPPPTDYHPPPDFDRRNLDLRRELSKFVKAEDRAELKEMSGRFRRGELIAREYYDRLKALMGAEGFAAVFEELVCLCPVRRGQEDLLLVHRIRTGSNPPGLTSCHVCRQVLRLSDIEPHLTVHLHQ